MSNRNSPRSSKLSSAGHFKSFIILTDYLPKLQDNSYLLALDSVKEIILTKIKLFL